MQVAGLLAGAAAMRACNQRVESLPSNLVALVGGFRRPDHFEVDPTIRCAGPPFVET